MGPQPPGIVLVVCDGCLLLDGLRPLHEWMRKVLPLCSRLSIASCIAESLVALHDRSLCHGGLAARCVHVGVCGMELQVKVADAGVVGALLRTGALGPHGRLALGPAYARYLAPEGWALSAADADMGPPSDIWSLGLLVMEILGGGAPHADCENMAKLSAKVLPHRGRSPGLAKRVEDLARFPILEALVGRCLDADRGRRPQASEIY